MHVACVYVCVSVVDVTYFTTVMTQGCAKEVNIIRSIRPTSVQDFDKQGYKMSLVILLGVLLMISLNSNIVNVFNSRTPLHWAAACVNPDVIKALLAAEGTLHYTVKL